MNASPNTSLTLSAFAQMPFMDCIELAAVTGTPERTVRDVLGRLQRHGLIEVIRHARPDGVRVRRGCLTPLGIDELAQLRMDGSDAGVLIVENDLLSAQGRRYLLRRLDAASVIYRVAVDAAASFDGPAGLRFIWRWERQGPLYAVFRTRSERTVAISRIGSTHTGEAINSRLRTLRRMHERGSLKTTLLIVPGATELERVLQYMNRMGVNDVFIATEAEVLSSPPGSRLWNRPDADLLTIREILKGATQSGLPRTRRPEERRTMPAVTLADDADDLDLVPGQLNVSARSLLRMLYDWPFVSVERLQQMTGVSEGHLGREKGMLSRHGLIHHMRIGRTAKQRWENRTRVVLSSSGLRYLSRDDRSSEQLIREHWLVEPHEGGDEAYRIEDYIVRGGKARTLLRERRHTDGVYDFIGLLLESCRNSRTWELAQLLPAHRWERRYKYGRRYSSQFPDISRAIRPDATLILDHPSRMPGFVLEFERRAKNPSKMAPKLTRYRTYFAASETENDFLEGRPTVLFVFESREYASAFAKYASTDGGPALPMLVSSLEELRNAGSVFAACWLHPWTLDQGHLPFMPLSPVRV